MAEKARSRKTDQRRYPATSLIAAAVGLALIGAGLSGRLPAGKWSWAAVGLFLVVLGAVCARTAASLSRRAEDLVSRLKSVVEGRDTARGMKARRIDSLLLGDRLHPLVEELVEDINALRREKRRAEAVLANMADGVIVADADLRVSLVNRAAGGIFQGVTQNAVGRQLSDLGVHPEVLRVADNCIRDRRDADAEFKLPGWPQRVIKVRATPFRISGADSAIIILHDVSEVRRHEQHEREFVSNVSHELKTPITAVRTTAEALLSGAKNDPALVDRFLNNIITESDRLSVLIEDLMEIARMDSGAVRIEKTDVDIARVVNRALDAVNPQAAKKGIMITTSIERDLTAYCDEVQAIHMVRNLVDNAVKYTPEGGQVQVTGRKTDSGVEIKVKDSGIGIPHGEVDRIFERFYRVDKARSRRLGGTGLGLAIVKEIVESHGGKITVDTQLGNGSTFTVALPAGPQGHGDA